MTDGTEAGGGYAPLLALQALDSRVDQLRYQREHHPSRLALNELLARHKKLAAEVAPLEARVAEFDARQGELEREIGETDARVATIEARLKAGNAGSYRDEGAMSEEIASLRRRKSALEDDELEVMEAREPADEALAALRADDGSTAARAKQEHATLLAAEAALDRALAEAAAERATLAGGVEGALLADYEKLRAHLDGVGVARLEHGVCSGCNLALSAGERDRIVHAAAGERFHCEQCGRILVP
ncbi:MAG TPA: C4-type zinc ribbon domain-containing protein [Acidimicrobiales bacterium]|nr:C4-type zinc ribbon domain-containing protein [Acidimicrobiales bacterium]